MTKLLILDDDQTNVNVFTAVLAAEGFEIFCAISEEEAIDLSQQNPQIGFLVCDVGVGSSSGTEIALRICGLRPGLPVLFVSGTPMFAWQTRDKNNLLKFPVDFVDCLEKPFRPVALVAKVKELLEKRAQRPQGRTAGDGRQSVMDHRVG